MEFWSQAAIWIGLAFLASLISIRLGISVAMIEIFVGALGGNFLGIETTPWINVLAGIGSVLLTFLAGTEVDPMVLRQRWKESLSIGCISFLLPFLAAMAYAYYIAGWSLPGAKIAGIALSTTSVAIVYAVMVETGLNGTELGKIILAACFITDLGTVVALGVLFTNYNLWLLLFVGAMIAVLPLIPAISRKVFETCANRVSEPETKFFFLLLFGLGALAVRANSEAVLPAYLVGLCAATVLAGQRQFVRRLRGLAFAFFTPFYFLKAGMFVSFKALFGGIGLIAVLLAVKMAAKLIGVWPLTKAFRFSKNDGVYTTLLMSTGLTFGTISSLFGLTYGHINQSQYSILVTVVILSGIVPTLVAQSFYAPRCAPHNEPTVSADAVPLEQTLIAQVSKGGK
jgi:Kef-type K+ transport system membrane component KefB